MTLGISGYVKECKEKRETSSFMIKYTSFKKFKLLKTKNGVIKATVYEIVNS